MKSDLNPTEDSLFAAEASPAVESVTDFTRRIKRVLETGVRPGWVRGEISNLRAQASGHFYFSLKDAGAQLSAVLFRGDAARQSVKLRDGLQILIYGEISVYEQRGQYQFIVRAIIEDGVGRLQREFEALKQRLAAEGLFAAERKRAIPELPRTVGFITSPTGAAVQDFARILKRRGWRGRVIVLPTKVQGEGAALELAAMLNHAQTLGLFDLIVIGRGGGSLEDLWAFNEEVLVRAIAASSVPIISAVGHEIDFTLADFAADVRAETPSAAAELISSHFIAAAQRAEQAGAALGELVDAALLTARETLDHARSRLRLLTPAARIERCYLQIDDISNRLTQALREGVKSRRHHLVEARVQLAQHSPERRIQFESHRLLALWKRLQATSPENALRRGFVIVRDDQGRPVTRRAAIKSGQRLEAEFADGTQPLRAEEK